MKKKTKLKLNKRWMSKPLHHIDANLLLGELFPDNERFRIACKNYLDKISFNYRCEISTLSLGEVYKKSINL